MHNNKTTANIPYSNLTGLKLDYPLEIETNIICILETDLSKLFESNKLVTARVDPDAKIILHDAPFIQFENLKLSYNFRKYLETSVISKKMYL